MQELYPFRCAWVIFGEVSDVMNGADEGVRFTSSSRCQEQHVVVIEEMAHGFQLEIVSVVRRAFQKYGATECAPVFCRELVCLWLSPLSVDGQLRGVVLHPRHKLSYFKSADWEDDWINTAEALVRD
jgi:hypothetical protein